MWPQTLPTDRNTRNLASEINAGAAPGTNTAAASHALRHDGQVAGAPRRARRHPVWLFGVGHSSGRPGRGLVPVPRAAGIRSVRKDIPVEPPVFDRVL
jgi:hypothetical protein